MVEELSLGQQQKLRPSLCVMEPIESNHTVITIRRGKWVFLPQTLHQLLLFFKLPLAYLLETMELPLDMLTKWVYIKVPNYYNTGTVCFSNWLFVKGI